MHRLLESARRLPQSQAALRIAQARDLASEKVQAKRRIARLEFGCRQIASQEFAV